MPLTALKFLATICLLAATVARGAALASVGGEAITAPDVVAAEGKLPRGADLKEALVKLVERRLVLRQARAKGLDATPEEVNRAATLAFRAYAPNQATDDAAFRRYLAEEIIVKKYIDLYIFPRIVLDDDHLRPFFVAQGSTLP